MLDGGVLRCWRVWCWNVLDCGMSVPAGVLDGTVSVLRCWRVVELECVGLWGVRVCWNGWSVGWYCICVKVLEGVVLEGARIGSCQIVGC